MNLLFLILALGVIATVKFAEPKPTSLAEFAEPKSLFLNFIFAAIAVKLIESKPTYYLSDLNNRLLYQPTYYDFRSFYFYDLRPVIYLIYNYTPQSKQNAKNQKKKEEIRPRRLRENNRRNRDRRRRRNNEG